MGAPHLNDKHDTTLKMAFGANSSSAKIINGPPPINNWSQPQPRLNFISGISRYLAHILCTFLFLSLGGDFPQGGLLWQRILCTGIRRTPISKLKIFNRTTKLRWLLDERSNNTAPPHDEAFASHTRRPSGKAPRRREPSAEASVSPRSPRSSGIISRHNAKSPLCAAGPLEAGSRSTSPGGARQGHSRISNLPLPTCWHWSHMEF